MASRSRPYALAGPRQERAVAVVRAGKAP